MSILPTDGRARGKIRAVFPTLVAGVLAFAGSAQAADFAGGTLTVVRDAETADCPDEAELGRATLALGTPPPARTTGVDVRVVFQRDAFGYGALVRTTGAQSGEREIRKPGPTCVALAEAVSVVLAVVFDLAPPEEAPPSEPAPVAPPPVAPVVAPPRETVPVRPPPSPPPRPAPESPFVLGFGAQGGAGYGLLGAVPVGAVSAAARPSIGRWELGLGALWAPNRTVEYLGRSVFVSVLSGRLEACGWIFAEPTRLDVGVCAGLLLGRLRGAGDGFTRDITANDVWLAAEGGGAMRVPFSANVALRLGISVLVPGRRYSFTVAGAGRAFQSSSAAGLLEAGPELRFP